MKEERIKLINELIGKILFLIVLSPIVALLIVGVIDYRKKVAAEVIQLINAEKEEGKNTEDKDLLEVDLHELGLDYRTVETSVSTLVDYSVRKTFQFTPEVGPSMAFCVADGQIRTVQICSFQGYPTCLYYVSEDKYQSLAKNDRSEANYLIVDEKPLAKICVDSQELLIDYAQLNTFHQLFEGEDILKLTEIGQLGYYEDGIVDLSSYLEDCGMVQDENGIYWSSEEKDRYQHEGFSLKVAVGGYIIPEFYAKNKDSDEILSWKPDEEVYNSPTKDEFYNPMRKALLNGEEVKVSEFVLEGIMQCVQRSGSRYIYAYLNPGYSAISSNDRLFYGEIYSNE